VRPDSPRYLNSDLELASSGDLRDLAAALTSRGMLVLHVGPAAGGGWRAAFETGMQYDEPESNIDAVLTVVESLDSRARAMWTGCSEREINIGYQCGAGPWASEHGLSNGLLERIARLGASLRITLYPKHDGPGS
jgi:hypothetical protein